MTFLHPDLAMLVTAIIGLILFVRLHRQINGKITGFIWIFSGILIFLTGTFFDYLEDTPLSYLMYPVTNDDRWDYLVMLFAYAPGGILICIGFSAWIKTATALQKEIDQREITEQELKKALIETGNADRAKSRFLAAMSHEVRTPLNAIIGFSELMAKPQYTKISQEKQVEYSTIIWKSGTHLLATMDDILSLAQLETRQHDMKEEIFAIEDVVNEALFTMAAEADRAQVTLTRKVTGAYRLFGDRRIVKQILVNLLSNAVKYTSPKGSVHCALKIEDGDLSVRITDTGIGMTPFEIERAMQAFVQLDQSAPLAGSGKGLGLTLSARFMELHGGSLDVKSVKNQGTEIKITFPASRLRAVPTAT